ncbi:MAG: serine hydrolase domain-containing protein [Verrucomicrobiota bacterium]
MSYQRSALYTLFLILAAEIGYGQDVALEWLSKPGENYLIEQSSDLSAWETEQEFEAEGFVSTVPLDPTEAAEFWRIGWPGAQSWILQQTAEPFATYLVEQKKLVPGIMIGVTWNGKRWYHTAGVADSMGNPFSQTTPFQIGSVTKVLTTAVFGRKVVSGEISLVEPVQNYTEIVSSLEPSMQPLTLFQLSTMTAGLPSTPPLCSQSGSVVGCLPNGRPEYTQYTPADLISYLENVTPQTFSEIDGGSPTGTTSLPAPWHYADISTGILGLLLPYDTDEPFSNNPVEDYWSEVTTNLLQPLGMQDTMLSAIDGSQLPGSAEGFNNATANPTVDNGAITSLNPDSPGDAYESVPTVSVSGGGNNAQFEAVVSNQQVTSYTSTDTGSGYSKTAIVTAGGNSTTTATLVPTVNLQGGIEKIIVISGGAGYDDSVVVSATGSGSGFTATATVIDGEIYEVIVTDPGSGYGPPIGVDISLPSPTVSPVPAWAAAGAAQASMRDMLSFLEATLGHSEVNGNTVPADLTDGLALAITPYTPTGGTSGNFAGFAWSVIPENIYVTPPLPGYASKNGSLPGFATQVVVVPDLDLGIAVFINSRNNEAYAEMVAVQLLKALMVNMSLPEFTASARLLEPTD